MQRKAEIERVTKETDIALTFCLDGAGEAQLDTGLPFLDHMLSAFTRHGHFDLSARCRGDLEVDAHHTVEDIGLVMGQGLREALGDKAGITRYGWALTPMDGALARVALDLSGRPFLRYGVALAAAEVGGFDVCLFREFFQALVNSAGLALHIDVLAGEEAHHIFEAVFKAFGRALDQAVGLDPRCTGVPSTKGVLA